MSFILAILGAVTMSAFFFFIGWQFAYLVPAWIKEKEARKEARNEERLRSLQYYVKNLYRRA